LLRPVGRSAAWRRRRRRCRRSRPPTWPGQAAPSSSLPWTAWRRGPDLLCPTRCTASTLSRHAQLMPMGDSETLVSTAAVVERLRRDCEPCTEPALSVFGFVDEHSEGIVF
jgi:hypothetical protein